MTILIWDPDLIMPSDDLFESQEQPVEVLVIQTCSKGPPSSKDTAATQTSSSKVTSDHPKTPFVLGKKPYKHPYLGIPQTGLQSRQIFEEVKG
jgi:hypothetical protein